MNRELPILEIRDGRSWIVVLQSVSSESAVENLLKQSRKESNTLVPYVVFHVRYAFEESCFFEMKRKWEGKYLFRLHVSGRSIENKYREGKMKRTLWRELKLHETAENEVLWTVLYECYSIVTQTECGRLEIYSQVSCALGSHSFVSYIVWSRTKCDKKVLLLVSWNIL